MRGRIESRNTRRLALCCVSLLMTILLVYLAGCGGGGSSSGNSNTVSISTNTSADSIAVSASRQFTATVSGTSNTAVNWSVQEGSAGGTVTGAGSYTAPSVAGPYHVIAASQQDPSKTAIITVRVHVIVAVTPATPIVSIQRSITLTAAVAGSSNNAVTWSVLEAGGGSITPGGVYTAPNVVGVYHIIATSAVDPTQSVTTAVTVQSSSATGAIQ